MSGLKVVDANLGARDMRRDRKNGNATAMAVEKAVDQVKVARAAAACADRKLARQMRFSTRGECCAFLVTRVDPFDSTHSPEGVRQAVERIADDAVNVLDACQLENASNVVGRGHGHGSDLPCNGRQRATKR
jgi:hypothetical protein